MVVEMDEHGSWVILAPWLDTPVTGDSFFDAYWEAMALRLT